MVETLIPCPFCGGTKAGIVSFAKQGKKTVGWAVWCNNHIDRGGECAANGPPMPSEAEAVGAWNQRALEALPAQPVSPESDLLDEALEALRWIELKLSKVRDLDYNILSALNTARAARQKAHDSRAPNPRPASTTPTKAGDI